MDIVPVKFRRIGNNGVMYSGTFTLDETDYSFSPGRNGYDIFGPEGSLNPRSPLYKRLKGGIESLDRLSRHGDLREGLLHVDLEW